MIQSSGFFIDAAGVILTNRHIVADANEIVVRLNADIHLECAVGRDHVDLEPAMHGAWIHGNAAYDLRGTRSVSLYNHIRRLVECSRQRGRGRWTDSIDARPARAPSSPG